MNTAEWTSLRRKKSLANWSRRVFARRCIPAGYCVNYFLFGAEKHDEARENQSATRSERQRFMNEMYYYLILVDAAVSFAAAWAVFWKNRYQIVGPLLGTAVLMLGLWAACFAQYFRPLDPVTSLWWAKLTLSTAILFLPCFFHGICALAGREKGLRWWILASYVSVFIVLI